MLTITQYKEQQKRMQEFVAQLHAIPEWGDTIKQEYVMERRGLIGEIVAFRFSLNATVPKEVRELCYEYFLAFFPTGILGGV